MKKLLIVAFFLCFAAVNASFAQQENREDYWQKSLQLELQNKLPEAIAELNKLIALEPSNADLYLRRAELNFALNNRKAVAADVLLAVGFKPDDQKTVVNGAHHLRNVGECSQSVDILTAFLERNKTSDEAIYARGIGRYCLKDLVGALEDFSAAVELKPDNGMYLASHATMISRMGDFQLSAEKFEKLIKILRANYSKAMVFGGLDKAGGDLARALAMRAAISHGKQDEESEFADLDKSIEYYPAKPTYRHRAKIYVEHKMYDKAIADYTYVLEKSPKDTTFRIERGDAYLFAERFDEAIKDYEEALRLDATLKEPISTRIALAKKKMQEK